MKKLIIASALGLVISAQTFAEGSKITGSTISNKATVSESTNSAEKGGEANMATIKIKGAEITGSTISNDVTLSGSTNDSTGGGSGGNRGPFGLSSGGENSTAGSQANMGAVVIE